LLLGHVDEAKADITEAMSQGGEADGDVLAVAASLGMDGYVQYVLLSLIFHLHPGPGKTRQYIQEGMWLYSCTAHKSVLMLKDPNRGWVSSSTTTIILGGIG